MSLAQLGLVLLLSLGLEATPQNFPGMSQSTADWYIRRFNKMAPDMIPEQILGFNKMAPDMIPEQIISGFNKMADLPVDPYAVFQTSGPPSSPPISPYSKYDF